MLAINLLLCPTCNQVFGLFKERVSSLRAAIQYLEKYPKVGING